MPPRPPTAPSPRATIPEHRTARDQRCWSRAVSVAEDRGFELMVTPRHRGAAIGSAGLLTCDEADARRVERHAATTDSSERVASTVAWDGIPLRCVIVMPSGGAVWDGESMHRRRQLAQVAAQLAHQWAHAFSQVTPVGSVGSRLRALGSPVKGSAPVVVSRLSRLSRLSQLGGTCRYAGGHLEPTGELTAASSVRSA